VEMDLNQETIHTINGIQGVIKFVGTGRLPMPLRPDEVNRLLGVEEAIKEEEPAEAIPFLVGQVVEITEGPFSDFSGTVQEVLPDKGKVRVSVARFGRRTPVQLDYLSLKAHWPYSDHRACGSPTEPDREKGGTEKGSATSKREKVGKVTRAQLKKIAEIKMQDLNATDLEGAINMIAGTARSMGLTVEG